jgi:hypothetical protein
MQEGWNVDRLRDSCSKAKDRWLAPGEPLTIPSKFIP